MVKACVLNKQELRIEVLYENAESLGVNVNEF
jgi:hypothetical protein